MHASKTDADKQHVKEAHSTQLSSGDIVSNKLNYHKSCCYKDFVNKYNQKKLIESTKKYRCRMKSTSFGKQFASTR